MIFHSQGMTKKDGSLIFSGDVSATAHPCLNKDIIREFWRNFTFRLSTLKLNTSNEFIFSIGNTPRLPLDGHAYSINVEPNGVCVFAENERDLIHGFMTLLDRFKAIDNRDITAIEAKCCHITDKALIAEFDGNRKEFMKKHKMKKVSVGTVLTAYKEFGLRVF